MIRHIRYTSQEVIYCHIALIIKIQGLKPLLDLDKLGHSETRLLRENFKITYVYFIKHFYFKLIQKK